MPRRTKKKSRKKLYSRYRKKQYGGYKYNKKKTLTRKIFNQLDINNNGILNIDEFNSGIERITKHKIKSKKQLFKNFDTNNDGVINYNEFKLGFKKHYKKK